MRFRLALMFLGVTCLASACKVAGPPGSTELAILEAEAFSKVNAVVVLALGAALYFLSKRLSGPAILLGAMSVLHPAWFLDGGHGDCGMLMETASFLWTLAAVGVFVMSNRFMRRKS